MKAEHLRAWVAERFETWPVVGDAYRCHTGADYVALVNDAVKPEGDRIESYATDEEQGVLLWKKGFDEYVKGRTGVVFWRELPVWEFRPDPLYINGVALKLGVVYSRLVISELGGPW